MKRVVDFCKSVGDSKVAVQLAHAGRKASAERPWEGGNALNDGAWQTYGPSAIAFADGWHVPEALDEAGLARIKDAFVAAAKRAVRLGIGMRLSCMRRTAIYCISFCRPSATSGLINMAVRLTIGCAFRLKCST